MRGAARALTPKGRATNDQTMPLDPCRLRLLYQGRDPNSGGEYSQLPYRLGLATQTNSTC